jgi:uncharacterized phage protein gp47/JayE
MPYATPTFEQTRDLYLQAVRSNGKPDAPIGPDSDNYVRACAVAAVGEAIFAHQAYIIRQQFPDTADADNMERQANQRRLFRKPAAVAGGMVRFTGTPGVAVAIGQQVLTTQGTRYQTTAAGLIPIGGTVDVPAVAIVAGSVGNLADNTPVTVDAPLAGLLVAALSLTMTSGADIETDDALLGRLLLRLGNPPQGGAVADYQQWALAVPGVARALVYPIRRGRGTVDVVPMPAAGLPSGPLVAAVQAYIDGLRPVGMGATGFQALAPTAVPVVITLVLTYAAGASPATVRTAVAAAIASLFTTLAPGDTLFVTRLVSTIMAVSGVTDVVLTLPAANTVSVVDANNLQVLTQGATNIT